MPNCSRCDYSFPPRELTDGKCRHCLAPELVIQYQEKLKKEQILREIQIAKCNAIILSEEISMKEEMEQIELISSNFLYGMNEKKYFCSTIIDLIIGNIKSSKNSLENAENKVRKNFRQQACSLGGNAVIAIKMEHTKSDAGAMMMSVSATGTVVKLEGLEQAV